MKAEDKYKCGHERGIVIMDSNILSMTAYFMWKDSTGYDGNKTQCWECYCQEVNKVY